MPSTNTAVNQYDKNTGELVGTYKGTTTATEVTGVHNGNLVRCLKGYRKSAGGYRWEYVHREHRHKNNCNIITLMKDLEGNVLKEFPSTSDAAEYILKTDLTKATQMRCVRQMITNSMPNSKNYTTGKAYGYRWEAKESALQCQ